MSREYSEEGFLLDEYGHEIGDCNACGQEALVDSECCDGGEIVPPKPEGEQA